MVSSDSSRFDTLFSMRRLLAVLLTVVIVPSPPGGLAA